MPTFSRKYIFSLNHRYQLNDIDFVQLLLKPLNRKGEYLGGFYFYKESISGISIELFLRDTPISLLGATRGSWFKNDFTSELDTTLLP
jgi:hypothetical protein